jgi:hypothetical protein
MASSPQKSTRKKQPLTAATADRHVLYEASVQDTAADIEFVEHVYKKMRHKVPQRLREDFCGTAKLCADWAASAPQRHAYGLDLHQPTLNWGRRRHLAPLTPAQQARVSLLRRNVLEGVEVPVDVTVAFNFSYCVFKDHAGLLAYFKNVFACTRAQGAFFLDIHGGNESFDELEESTKHRGFTYIWDQGPYDPITGFVKRRIHFGFPDGTQIRPAFTYDWRMWTLPELQDILCQAGFAQVDVYWEGADKKGCGNGVFRKQRRAAQEASWIAYVVAWRKT